LAIWKSRNKDIFDKKWIKHPTEVVVYACTFMSYWIGLYNATIQEQIAGGVKTMLAIAYKLLARQRPSVVQMLPAPQDEAVEDKDNA
jgi:anaerobic C4-dicarboxylate transporter